MGTPLIKYYKFTPENEENTCYDGKREFIRPSDSKSHNKQQRYYPDEYLIANIVKKYLSTRLDKMNKGQKDIIVLAEKWRNNGGNRDGGKNTSAINQQIQELVNGLKQSDSKETNSKNTLILVPFLYGSHHPGIAIDVNNRIAIYLDPYGKDASVYRETDALQQLLVKQGFNFEYVSTQQQNLNYDGTSCGPILTASMIKLIEEFLAHGKITTLGFETHKKNLATDRLFQMYVNNNYKVMMEGFNLGEIMLADESLWKSFIAEQRLQNLGIERELLSIVSKHKHYIRKLKAGWDNQPICAYKIQLINQFQSRILEQLFLKSQDMKSNIRALMNAGKKITSNSNESKDYQITSALSTLPLLLQPKNLNQTQKILHLNVITADSLDTIFDEFSRPIKNKDIVARNKKSILNQACDNLDIPYTGHTPQQLQAIKNELKQIVYSDGEGLSEIFTEGIVINGNDEHLKRGLALLQKNFETEKDPLFLLALREEMRKVFANICAKVTIKNNDSKSDLNADDAKQFKIFLSNLLAAYPFLDPVDDEVITIPQEVNGGWIKVNYRINKIDISPQTGLLPSLLEDEDRMYAYTLTPVQGEKTAVKSHLLLMGTTYPTGQGADLADLYNFYPNNSLGEAHDLRLVDDWIRQQKNKIQITGHSKGATMAMIVAAHHPDKVAQADCLNSAGLCDATLERLQPRWDSLKPEQKPCINVNVQDGDPVFPLENGFLQGTHIHRIFSNTVEYSNLNSYIPRFIQQATAAHLQHRASRLSAFSINVSTSNQNISLKREFFSDIKSALNWSLFPIKYARLVAFLGARKLYKKCASDPTAKPGWLFSGLNKIGSWIATLITIPVVIAAVTVAAVISAITISVLALDRSIHKTTVTKEKTNSHAHTSKTTSDPLQMSYAKMGKVLSTKNDSRHNGIQKLAAPKKAETQSFVSARPVMSLNSNLTLHGSHITTTIKDANSSTSVVIDSPIAAS